ncbi:MFS transporter [Actinomadura fulvescens]|uniref:MFS transporter n=1 Tax=Actinomadura fulvescens TaxID=46160 RepID=A0ABN3PWZ7_9ACTN
MPLAIYILGLSIFAQGTSELMLAGLLTEMATDLGVSVPQAGLLISAFALGMLVGAPVLAVVTLRWPRRDAPLVFLAVFIVAHIVAALTPGYWVLFATRVVGAFVYAGFWAVAATTALGLVPANARGKAMRIVAGSPWPRSPVFRRAPSSAGAPRSGRSPPVRSRRAHRHHHRRPHIGHTPLPHSRGRHWSDRDLNGTRADRRDGDPGGRAGVLLGAFGFATNPALNTRVLALAEGIPTLAAAADVSAFNVGITAGTKQAHSVPALACQRHSLAGML